MVNTIYFLAFFVIPVGFQFSSLVFGFIRNQNKKKYRLGDQNNYPSSDRTTNALLSSQIEDDQNEGDLFLSQSGSSSSQDINEQHQEVQRISEVSGQQVGLCIDYFDPPLLDYMKLFESDDKGNDQEVVIYDSSAAKSIVEDGDD